MSTIRQHNLFIVGYGLGGGFGGIRDYEVVNTPSLEVASKDAYWLAVEQYQSFEGLHGLRSEEEILQELIEEEGYEESDETSEIAREMYEEEMENWIDYTCFPWSKEEEKLAKRYNYHNPFNNITSKKSK